MIRLNINNYNMILKQKKQKYQHYHLEKFINMNTLQVKNYYLLIKRQKIKQAKFSYSSIGKAFEIQAKTIEDQGKQ